MLRCGVVWAIFKRNFASYFTGSLGYLFISAFVFADAFLTFTADFFTSNVATLEHLTANMPLLLLFFVPAITMSVWADERKQGTDELLFTLPTTDVEILLGKYFAVLGVYTVSLAFTLTKIAVFAWLASPDGWLIAATYLGYWLAGAALLGAGMFASAVTSSATAAFVRGVVVCSIPVFVDLLPLTPDLSETLSIGHHLEQFGKGLVPLAGLVYFVSLAAFTLYLNYVLITRRHWGAESRVNMEAHYAVRLVAVLVFVVGLNYAVRCESEVTTLRIDATAEKVHTLSKETRTIVAEVPEQTPVTIEAFVSPNLPPEHVAQGKSLRNLLRQYDRLGGDLVSTKLLETRPHTAEATAAEKWEIQPRSIAYQDETGQRRSDVFLGAVVHSPRGQVVIPFFDEALSIEHELTRAVSAVTQRERLRIGIVATDAEVLGGQRSRQIAFADFLEEYYEVESVFPSSAIDLDRNVEFALLDAKRKEFREEHAAKVAEREAAKKAAEEAKKEPELKPMPEPAPGEESEEGDGSDPESPTDDGAPKDEGAADEEPADDAEPADEEETEPADEPADAEATEDDPPATEPEPEPLPDVDEYVADAMKAYEKETPRSEYFEEDPTESLDAAKISDDLRKRFGWRNVRLSPSAKVKVVEKGKKWTVTDVNPEKEYTVEKTDGQIRVTMPRYDVLVAVMPSTLDEPQMKNLVDYVKTGRPVLVFDDPLPFHLPPRFAVDLSPVQPKPQQSPQMAPGNTPKKAAGGRATPLLDALGITWTYDEIVWDEYDPHPNLRRFPVDGTIDPKLLYVGPGNGTPTAIAGSVAPGLGELLFVYPGRVNPLTDAKFDFDPLVRVGTSAGTYDWTDVVQTFPPGSSRGRPVGIVTSPKQTPEKTKDGERKSQFCIAAHITTKSSGKESADGAAAVEAQDDATEKRNVIFVADVDAIGWIPMVAFVEQSIREYYEIEFAIDNRAFVLNAIDVLGGRGDLVELRDRRPRLPTLRTIERSKQKLEEDKAEFVRETRQREEDKIEEYREAVKSKQQKIAESEGLTRTEQLQESVMALYSEGVNLDRNLRQIREEAEEEIDKYEAGYRQEVAGLHERARIAANVFANVPSLLLWIVGAIWQFTRERSNVDPRRARD